MRKYECVWLYNDTSRNISLDFYKNKGLWKIVISLWKSVKHIHCLFGFAISGTPSYRQEWRPRTPWWLSHDNQGKNLFCEYGDKHKRALYTGLVSYHSQVRKKRAVLNCDDRCLLRFLFFIQGQEWKTFIFANNIHPLLCISKRKLLFTYCATCHTPIDHSYRETRRMIKSSIIAATNPNVIRMKQNKCVICLAGIGWKRKRNGCTYAWVKAAKPNRY